RPPPASVRRLVGPWIRVEDARNVLEIGGVPHPIARHLDGLGLHRQGVAIRIDPFAKRAPRLARLLRAHALEHEREIERVAPPDLHLLAPMLVAQFLAVEEEKVLEQILEGGIGLRDDAAVDCAEVVRERMRSQRHPRDDSKRTAAPAAQSPEDILVLATVCY